MNVASAFARASSHDLCVSQHTRLTNSPFCSIRAMSICAVNNQGLTALYEFGRWAVSIEEDMAIGTEEKVVIFDGDKCSGCRICELVCSMRHHGEYNPKKSLIRIMANEEAGVYVPILDIQCQFCGECVEACPLEALSITELGEAVIARKNTLTRSFPIPVYSITGT